MAVLTESANYIRGPAVPERIGRAFDAELAVSSPAVIILIATTH